MYTARFSAEVVWPTQIFATFVSAQLDREEQLHAQWLIKDCRKVPEQQMIYLQLLEYLKLSLSTVPLLLRLCEQVPIEFLAASDKNPEPGKKRHQIKHSLIRIQE